jgi:hypothetical protein
MPVTIDVGGININIDEIGFKFGDDATDPGDGYPPELRDDINNLKDKSDSIKDDTNGLPPKIDDIKEEQEDKFDEILAILNQEYSDSLELENCDEENISASYSGANFQVILSAIKALNPLLDSVQKSICEIDPISAVPDWWAMRRGADRPQLSLIFRCHSLSRSYHSINLPHPRITEPPEQPILPSYFKGNFQYSLYLLDNSRLLINCMDAQEAMRVGGILISYIDPAFLPSEPIGEVIQRRNAPVEICEMSCSAILYFDQGRRDLKPVWRKKYPIPVEAEDLYTP